MLSLNFYIYLVCNKLPPYEAAIRTEALAEIHLLVDSLLYRLNTTPGSETAVLAVPESCVEDLLLCIILVYLQDIIRVSLKCIKLSMKSFSYQI